ncbi:hypothetical protein [Erwinia sp.]|uniref:hypothetical protein n=1 Tax=Erwinia citreus TaxID=558 RepID=UPI003C74E885
MSVQVNELGNIDDRQATRGESLVGAVSVIIASLPFALASCRNKTSADFTFLQVTSFCCAVFAAISQSFFTPLKTTNLLPGVLVKSLVFPILSLLNLLHANKSTPPVGQSSVGLRLSSRRFASICTMLLKRCVSGFVQFQGRFGLTRRGLGRGITFYNTSSIAL